LRPAHHLDDVSIRKGAVFDALGTEGERQRERVAASLKEDLKERSFVEKQKDLETKRKKERAEAVLKHREEKRERRISKESRDEVERSMRTYAGVYQGGTVS
jgi:hypothetical protein